MKLTGLRSLLQETSAFQNLLAYLKSDQPNMDLSLGVIRSARPFAVATLAQSWEGAIIFVTARPENAYNTAEQLPVWIDETRITRFNEATAAFYERIPWAENAISGRIAALSALLDDDPIQHPIVVVSARALMQRTLPASQFRRVSVQLRVGLQVNFQNLLKSLLGLGYEPAPVVLEPGTFSRRGGIVDVYPITANEPVRIEFFDDEIDNLRAFDPTTQRSTVSLRQLTLTPAREALPMLTPMVAPRLREWFGTLSGSKEDAANPLNDLARLESGATFATLEHYLPFLYPMPVNLLDYAADNALIVVDDWDSLRDMVQGLEDDAETTHADKLAMNEIAPDHPRPYVTWDELEESLNAHRVIRLGSSAVVDVDFETMLGTGPALFGGLFTPEQRFGGQLKPFLAHVRELQRKGERAIIVSEQAHRLIDLSHEQTAYPIKPISTLDTPPVRGVAHFIHGAMREGWTMLAHDSVWMHVFTDAEIFGWQRTEPRRRLTYKRAKAAAHVEYTDWRENDYVVHVDYGIGQFVGMRRRTIDGTEREYLLVHYSTGAQLFVPIHQADRLTRYVGVDDRPPELSRLGQTEWSKIKARVQQNAEEEAKELLRIYTARANAPGYAFSPDTPWQFELEASFPYVETEDQLRAVNDVKRDMQSPHPMDRLICGDVGFGKTEVAIRAAFKAVQEGKQVAVLVPTTVLAQQHFETFSERMGNFPIAIELLSRFRTKEEQNRAVDRIGSGELDIIIGTHRILSNDIVFRDLGLVIIDEEQRFGVKQKEHFKALRTQVDVLTLTATPIPRTMYLSISGVRDISMIQTPPEERLPIATHVGVFDRSLVRSAIMRELERGGQIFFVHNRVRTIENIREQLEEIVPESRVVVAHGQMDGRTLSMIMRSFARAEFDVLVSTSIVESGIDIPNANTLIIDRADWFGLAQLYQLRGRVGRSAQQAYAYFFHPTHSKLTAESRARLETLAENTQLGAGFQVAMRDMEIRGAGDILSTRQSGHVASVGLYLYTQMLAESIAKLRTLESIPQKAQPNHQAGIVIDLPTPAYIPTDWIPEIALRLQIYRRIAALDTLDEVDLMRVELEDRFGSLPLAVRGLLFQIDVKVLARLATATAVLARQGKIEIRLPYLPTVDRKDLERKLGEGIEVSRVAVILPLYVNDLGSWQVELLRILKYLADAMSVSTV